MADIRLGTSGYSFDDWKGHVYPTNLKSSEMFPYYVNQYRLNTVEINYTFYRFPSTKVFEYYANNSPVEFDFTVKLFSGITHDPWISSSQAKVDKSLCARFIEAIKPITQQGKLGCLLAQFPQHMRCTERAWDYLISLRDSLGGLPIVYEFRHKQWISESTITRLKELGIGFCAVDGPLVGSLLPLVPAVTSDIAYLRLHGRNTNWYSDPPHRYDYMYSEGELRKLIPTIGSMASKSRAMYIEFNNCHAGAALRNVKMMQFFLGIDLMPTQRALF
jgi:uncharacterized protein YecE (DUF72 family)